jgi:hypothetical protein
MRLMFELKTEEMGGRGCRMWSFIIYSACSQILGYQRTITRWVRNVACMRVKMILNRFFVVKQEGKSPFRRLVRIWEDNIEMDFKELNQNGI